MSNTVYSLSVIIPTTQRQGVTASSLQKRKLRLRQGNWLASCNLKELSGNLGFIQGRSSSSHAVKSGQGGLSLGDLASHSGRMPSKQQQWVGLFFYEAKSYIGKSSGLEQCTWVQAPSPLGSPFSEDRHHAGLAHPSWPLVPRWELLPSKSFTDVWEGMETWFRINHVLCGLRPSSCSSSRPQCT